MKSFYYELGGRVVERTLPDADAQVMQGIPWGYPETPFTPAYWVTQYWMRPATATFSHRLGTCFREEVVVCLLGGYGIPAEIGMAAFYRLRESNLLECEHSEPTKLERALYEPLNVNGRWVRYRFWSQKARYISQALESLSALGSPPQDAIALREYLLKIPGVGPKTASWIVRNWLDSDEVAILDIHIIRAGIRIGLYSELDKVSTSYFRMEQRFLDFASAIEVPARQLDALIWAHMRHERHATTIATSKVTKAPADPSAQLRLLR